MERLLQVVRRYVSGEIGYGNFRNQFVRFMAESDLDRVVERLYSFVESGCSAFDNGYINQNELRSRLQHAVPPPVAFALGNNTAPAASVVYNVVNYMPGVV